ncbi:carboxymuconolactone decarboxylase family protein [Umezawaea sp. Da 62-37]|uniref:carboxymuconolactone decarboxylase family protein n=1 Tax=Umezawaea sp. Da 62-37 TaxID=3075927 RepID=UPI0028F6F658|nr:carboxymuconolactone decarboxylase family protein [Umezawaea sp. Da 62-37]WNV84570.1 carboxymuconolactone decarboxylase family protein [Umezawaea sp. Da 62-37]
MSPVVLGKALRRSLQQVRYVVPVGFGAADGLTRAVYRQVEREFGMLAPPVALHSPAPEVMAAGWMILRETMIASWRASRAAKEVVASMVSVNNSCPYCVAVHGATLHGLLRDPTAQAISEGRVDDIADPELLAIATWVRTGVRPRTTALPPDQAAELVGVAVAFEYYNRVVNVFLDESPLPSHVPGRMRGTMMRFLSVLMRGPASRRHAAGASLDLLAARGPAPDAAWAAGAPHVADAFARAAATMGAAGERSVPEPVRRLVTAKLARWDGKPLGLSRGWVDEALAGLPPADRPAGRVALLTAFASHQLGQDDVDGFKRGGADDRRLVEVVAWSAFAAASSRLATISASYR